MTIGGRAKFAIERLIALRQPLPEGGTGIDYNKAVIAVKSDPEAMAFGIRMAIDSGLAPQFGWGIWLTVALVFEKEFEDDSLMVILEAAATRSGQVLPSIKMSHTGGIGSEVKRDKKVVLQMAETDIANCDTFRLVRLLRLDKIDSQIRQQMSGNCIVNFPEGTDTRPVQHIPSIRAFVKDLHLRLPHFPIFLDLGPKYGMWMAYFGCLADPEATVMTSTDKYYFDVGHPSVLLVIESTLNGLRRACEPFQIDWLTSATAIVQYLEPLTGAELLRRVGTDPT